MVHRVYKWFHDRQFCFVIHVTDWRNGLPAVVVLSGHASDDRAKRKATPAQGWPEPCWRSLKLNEASGCMACQTSQAASRSCSVGLSSRIGRLRLRQSQHGSEQMLGSSVFQLSGRQESGASLVLKVNRTIEPNVEERHQYSCSL